MILAIKNNLKLFIHLQIILLPIFLQMGCRQYPEEVEFALEKSGENRDELFAAISYYQEKNDTLKLRALYYLIGQLPYYGTINYELVDKSGREVSFEKWDYKTLPIARETLNKNGWVFMNRGFSKDVKTVSKEYLISNIELSFKVWNEYPWCSDLNFDEFCKMILPHKYNGHPLDNWREYYYFKHKRELDSLKEVNATKEQVCFLLNKKYQKAWIKSAGLLPISYLTYDKLENIGGGTCDHLARNQVLMMRACGIPINLDLIPYHGRINGGHAYNSFHTVENEFIFFSPYERNPERRKWRAPRVLRYMFEIDEISLSKLHADDNPPGILQNPFLIDVTHQYFPTKDITVQLPLKSNRAYLCTYNEGSFSPIIKGTVDNTQVTFENVTKELLYFPMEFYDQTMVHIGNPFILKESGELRYFEKDYEQFTDIEGVKLMAVNTNLTRPKSKIELFIWDNEWKYITSQIAAEDSTLTFKNIPKNGLYLTKGPERLELVQRPFTYFNDIIEYW